MTKLTETQTIILSAGAQRPENIALPLPKGLAGAAATMAVSKMIEHGWLQEVDANLRRGEPLWRETGDGHGTTLVVTDAGLLAVGIDPVVVKTRMASRGSAKAQPAVKHPTLRAGTKQALLISMLQRPQGVSMKEIVAATGCRRIALAELCRERWARSWGWSWFLQKTMLGAGCIGSANLPSVSRSSGRADSRSC